MTEAAVLQDIRLALGTEPGLRLFRNNCGALRDHSGRLVRYGLHPGSADLIGWRSVVITPDMVGKPIAIFTALEVKTLNRTSRATPEQIQFLAAVHDAGGIARIVRCQADAMAAVGIKA